MPYFRLRTYDIELIFLLKTVILYGIYLVFIWYCSIRWFLICQIVKNMCKPRCKRKFGYQTVLTVFFSFLEIRSTKSHITSQNKKISPVKMASFNFSGNLRLLKQTEDFVDQKANFRACT